VSKGHERAVGDWVSRAFFFSLFTWLQPDKESFPGNARLPGEMPSISSSCDEDSAKTTLIDDDGKPSTTMHLLAGLQVPAAAPDHVKAGLKCSGQLFGEACQGVEQVHRPINQSLSARPRVW
jgi:hypothetical protein